MTVTQGQSEVERQESAVELQTYAGRRQDITKYVVITASLGLNTPGAGLQIMQPLLQRARQHPLSNFF
jgi:hypothetical protein